MHYAIRSLHPGIGGAHREHPSSLPTEWLQGEINFIVLKIRGIWSICIAWTLSEQLPTTFLLFASIHESFLQEQA
jgi:hypothetical protein